MMGWFRLSLLVYIVGGCGRLGFDPVESVAVDEAHGLLSVGNNHGCAVRDGQVWCWGEGAEGQLGNGATDLQKLPVQVIDVPPLVAVVSGGQHACALTDLTRDPPGAVYCWGYDNYLQLGDDRSVPARFVLPTDFPDPKPVKGLPGPAIELALGGLYSCALFGDGTVWCWGYDGHGQLGRGTPTDDGFLPGPVVGLTNVAHIAADDDTTCALLRDGRVSCWGENGKGQVGNGTQSDVATPTPIAGLTATAITVGGDHVCALVDEGRFTCWGENVYGELGDGTETVRSIPGTPSALFGYLAISAGTHHTCGIGTDGELTCWGMNYDGTLGDGTTTARSTPVNVTGFGGAASNVSAGDDATCALRRDDGAVLCWGYGSRGQLGDGRGLMTTAQPIAGIDALAIAAADDHTCARTATGVSCWGEGNEGRLGDGTNTSHSAPAPVTGAWGALAVQDVVTGGAHTCALLGDASVWCWGVNDRGQLGDGTTTANGTPVMVGGGTGIGPVAAIAAGHEITCALLTDKTVSCWGDNEDGLLNDGSTNDSSMPVQVAGLLNIDELVVGRYHACVRAGPDVTCWGYNSVGQLGIGNTATSPPTLVPGVVATKLWAGGDDTCAQTAGGVVCWGSNESYQLGTANSDELVPVPLLVTNTTGFALSHATTCATGPELQCWGSNNFGQLGRGTVDYDTTAAVVSVPAPIAAVSVGDRHVCALAGGGGVMCWGDNNVGQLGLGLQSRSFTPVAVAFP